jgi:RNA polymerase sigma-70 factor, ECF subfamily
MTQEADQDRPPRYDEFIAEFSKNSRRLYGYIRSLVPDVNDANEAYQNASLVMWKKFDEFSPGTNFFSWGCQVSLFQVRKLRDAKKRGRMFSDEAIDALDAEFKSRGDDSSLRVDALSDCIQKLDPQERALIEQRYFQERKPQELAVELSRSVASVYRALARIHARLMACVQKALAGGA